ncbi:hypothetical protein ACIQU4_28595 [Streptomyces sp. NPDC090741]|uniref:hypothetical protein n=1 Tax=Streptomyces sp. NPDC090741 TaxID=3365967 RepID=UPI00380DA281
MDDAWNRFIGKLELCAETVATAVGRWRYKADGWADIETTYQRLEPAGSPSAPIYSLVRLSAECTSLYTLDAPDLSPGNTELALPLRPASAIVTYTSRDGRSWQIDAIDIIGRLVQDDESLSERSRRQRYHVETDPLTVATEFRTDGPEWLREFASTVRTPSPSGRHERDAA